VYVAYDIIRYDALCFPINMLQDEQFMQEAVKLALLGKGCTKTNPCVGAVIVKESQIIGRGWHKVFGSDHAEIVSLKEAGDSANGADIYVTLEPCSTYGKTPPCTKAIIEAGIKKVFIGVVDPKSAHSGRAIELLGSAGIEVSVGICPEQCSRLIEDFTKFMETAIPYVTVKIAQSLDSKIATCTGESKWITSRQSQVAAHILRKECDAVVVGVGTVLADDPELTVRHVESDRQPACVVFDSKCRIPLNSKLVAHCERGDKKLIIATSKNAGQERMDVLTKMGAQIIVAGDDRVDILDALKKLGELNIMNVMVEGGAELVTSFLNAKQVDRMCIFSAPVIIGCDGKNAIGKIGTESIRDAIQLKSVDYTTVGCDCCANGILNEYTERTLELTRKFM
jgi:diaminohydroxyphosphoribosylaminopyrimidine deaminase/5-amino-6-(5-phosphoribosylamino)uracil reductase